MYLKKKRRYQFKVFGESDKLQFVLMIPIDQPTQYTLLVTHLRYWGSEIER